MDSGICGMCGNPDALRTTGAISWTCTDCYIKIKNKQKFWSVVLAILGVVSIIFEILITLGHYGYFPPLEMATLDDVRFGAIFSIGGLLMIYTGHIMYQHGVYEIKRARGEIVTDNTDKIAKKREMAKPIYSRRK